MKNIFSGSPTTQAASPVKTSGKQFTDRIAPDPNFAEKNYPPQPNEAAYDLADAQEQQAMIRDALRNITGEPLGKTRSAAGITPASAPVSSPTAYGPTVGTVGDPYNQRYAKASVNIGGIHPVGASPSVQPASAPATNYSGNVFSKGPMQQAEDIRRAVALAQGPAPSRQQNQSDINVPGYPGAQADISPSQGDYSPSQAPAYDVSPSQQSGWTSAQRDAYLGSLGNSKTGQVPVSQNGGQPQGSPIVPAAPMTTLAPMPDWVDYSYLYNDYPQLALGATPNIGAFNQYNATFKRGGRVGDSIEAALRLALQGIVSRNKTS
jgi:hypothetical protein